MKTMIIAMLASIFSACGSGWPLGERATDRADEPAPKRSKPSPRHSTKPHADLAFPPGGVPVETFLAGRGQLPPKLAATELTLSFRSNVQPAIFECRRQRNETFRRCEQDRYTFGELVHGRVYELEVRARDSEGRVDLSPLRISFLVDQTEGERPEGFLPRDFGVGDLPPHLAASEFVSEKAEVNRALGIGAFFSVAIPFQMIVTSYSTTKTYTGGLKIFHRIGEHGGSAYKDLPCGRGYDRETSTGDAVYCEATPNAHQFARDFSPRLPENHIELVNGVGPRTDERVFVAAFDHSFDVSRHHLGISRTCSSSSQRGSNVLTAWRDYYQADKQARVDWCQVVNSRGRYFWVGEMDAVVDERNPHTYIRVIYTLAADQGILTRTQFLQRMAAFTSRVIVSTAPAEMLEEL